MPALADWPLIDLASMVTLTLDDVAASGVLMPGAPSTPERQTARFRRNTFARLDAARRPGENRSEIIRVAVEAELARREAGDEG
jgi:hypothetical protein